MILTLTPRGVVHMLAGSTLNLLVTLDTADWRKEYVRNRRMARQV